LLCGWAKLENGTSVRSMWYMPMHKAACELGGSLYCFSLFESISLYYKTSLVAWNRFQIWGGGGR
jgi:hypothetical protein